MDLILVRGFNFTLHHIKQQQPLEQQNQIILLNMVLYVQLLQIWLFFIIPDENLPLIFNNTY